MELVSKEKLEYRMTKEVQGKNGNYYLHTFEDSNSTDVYTLYSKSRAGELGLVRGENYNLIFSSYLFEGKMNYSFQGVLQDGKK